MKIKENQPINNQVQHRLGSLLRFLLWNNITSFHPNQVQPVFHLWYSVSQQNMMVTYH